MGWCLSLKRYGKGDLTIYRDTPGNNWNYPFVQFTGGPYNLMEWYWWEKILGGVLDAYQYAGNAQALTVATKMGDYIHPDFNRDVPSILRDDPPPSLHLLEHRRSIMSQRKVRRTDCLRSRCS